MPENVRHIRSKVIWVRWVRFWVWQMLKSLMGVQFNKRFWTLGRAPSHEHKIHEEYSWLCISMWYQWVTSFEYVLHHFTICFCFRQASLFADYFASLHKSKKQLLGQDLVPWCRDDGNSSSQNQKCLDCFTEVTVYSRPIHLSVPDTLYITLYL